MRRLQALQSRRVRSGAIAIIALALVLCCAVCLAQSGGEDAPEPSAAELCAERCADRACKTIRFEGFSKDSTTFGFTSIKCPGTHSKEASSVTYRVNRLKPGHGRLGTEGVLVKGRSFPRYFRQEGFAATRLNAAAEGKNAWALTTPDGTLRLRVALEVREKINWVVELSREGGDTRTFSGAFDEIYVGLVPAAFLSPDGKVMAALLTLDTGYLVDAVILLFSVE